MARFVHRKLEDSIKPFLARKEIIIIRGPRQAGKTTLMHVLSEGMEHKKFVDLEVSSNRNAISESPLDYVKGVMAESPLTLFLDEIQRLEGSGETLKIIYDEYAGRAKVVASGSSSLEIRNKTLSYLVGRAVVFELYPFDFGEFLEAKDPGLYKVYYSKHSSLMAFMDHGGEIESPSWSERLSELWKEYVVYGGYPEIVMAEDQNVKEKLLQSLVDLYIEKDVVSFFNIKNTKEFIEVVKTLSANTAQMLQLSALAGQTGVTRYKAEEIMSILENTYIAKGIYPYFRNTSTSIRKSQKLFFFDLGIRNAVLGNLAAYENRDDTGKLAENFVFRELLQYGDRMFYWRTKAGAEMDFVIETPGSGVLPIEVKLGGSGSLGKSFYSFIEKYRPERALVLTANEFSRKDVGGTEVMSVPIFYL